MYKYLKSMVLLAVLCVCVQAAVYYVAVTGSDTTGSGSASAPWATIAKAVSTIPDAAGNMIMVKDGTYSGTNSISRTFSNHIIIRAENSYKAVIANASGGGVKVLYITGSNMTFRGFEIKNQGTGTNEYLIHIEGAGAHHVIMENNIIHDNLINDMIKINSGAHFITIQGNVMSNPQPNVAEGIQHMDVNKINDVVIQDNIFFHDYAVSDQTHAASFIVIKNSSVTFDCHRVTVQRNIMLNWQGKPDQPMLLIGEDNYGPYGIDGCMIQNNLFIGNSTVPISGSLNIKGCKDVTFRSNTQIGNFPCGSWNFAHRLCQESGQPQNLNLFLYNNIWDDPTGTMTDFSDGAPIDSSNVIYDNNLYWNNGAAIPTVDAAVWTGLSVDTSAVTTNPGLVNPTSVTLPTWSASTAKFASGKATIREEFERLVAAYGAISGAGGAVNLADEAKMPADDILGYTRGSNMDIGAFEYGATGTTTTTTTIVAGSDPLASVKAFPNPFAPASANGGTVKFQNLPSGTTLTLNIFTVTGELLYELTTSSPDALLWDGRDKNGIAVPRGGYVCLIMDAEGHKKKVWVMLLK
ncbi:MAG: hypothetical protein A2231_05175 [Candidatus Firestonebacteria bacterium RIFOXYA2_FULL_40_8]|nr:MAG: hypothetical protein A2231_05175 [Candidatus Firestonebacteria bacterium RIFOXYA2_FULL_40_8]